MFFFFFFWFWFFFGGFSFPFLKFVAFGLRFYVYGSVEIRKLGAVHGFWTRRVLSGLIGKREEGEIQGYLWYRMWIVGA